MRCWLATRGWPIFPSPCRGLGTGPISLFGTDEQKERWLPSVARGTTISAFALSEREAGSDVSALAMRAQPDGNQWRLDGAKTWISNAGIAGLYVVFARTGEAPGAKGLSAFVVEADTPGFSVAKVIDLIAPHPIGALAFDGVKGAGPPICWDRPAMASRIAMATLDVFRSTVGAAALGFARRALDEALKHASTRKLFGQPLSDLQLTRAKLADMALAIDAAALLIYRAAWTKDVKGVRIGPRIQHGEAVRHREAQKVIDSAVQIFGGLGSHAGTLPRSSIARSGRCGSMKAQARSRNSSSQRGFSPTSTPESGEVCF